MLRQCYDIVRLVIMLHLARCGSVDQREALGKIDESTGPRKTRDPYDRNKQQGVKLSRATSLNFPITSVYISYERRNIASASLGS